MADRLKLGTGDAFDELVVAAGSIHMERLDANLLWLHVTAANGEEYRLELHSAEAIEVVVLQRPEVKP